MGRQPIGCCGSVAQGRCSRPQPRWRRRRLPARTPPARNRRRQSEKEGEWGSEACLRRERGRGSQRERERETERGDTHVNCGRHQSPRRHQPQASARVRTPRATLATRRRSVAAPREDASMIARPPHALQARTRRPTPSSPRPGEVRIDQLVDFLLTMHSKTFQEFLWHGCGSACPRALLSAAMAMRCRGPAAS